MVHRGGYVHLGVGVDPADNRIRVGSYHGHCHLSSLVDRDGTYLQGGWTQRPLSLAPTGPIVVSRPTGECRPRGQPASHSKDNPCGVSRFVSQAEPREPTNRRTRKRVTAIAHDQRTLTPSLPDRARTV